MVYSKFAWSVLRFLSFTFRRGRIWQIPHINERSDIGKWEKQNRKTQYIKQHHSLPTLERDWFDSWKLAYICNDTNPVNIIIIVLLSLVCLLLKTNYVYARLDTNSTNIIIIKLRSVSFMFKSKLNTQ